MPVSETLSAREINAHALVAGCEPRGDRARDQRGDGKLHLVQIDRKLDVADRTAAVAVAIRQGVITLG
jgi:hypothetical protein